MNFIFFLIFSASSLAAPPKTLWKEWYLVSQNGVPVSFFEEIAEQRPKEQELAITQRWVEKSQGRVETYIGSVSKESNLAPVAFFVEHKGGKSYKTDARAKEKRLEITFKPSSPDLAKSTEYASISSDSYLSSIVPTAIARQFKQKKNPMQFTAVVEDGGDMNVEIKKGVAESQSSQKKIGNEICREFLVKFDGKIQEWWITDLGKVCLVQFPDSGTKMELSNEKAVKKALGEKS